MKSIFASTEIVQKTSAAKWGINFNFFPLAPIGGEGRGEGAARYSKRGLLRTQLLIILFAALVSPHTGFAQEPLHDYKWQDLAREGKLTAGAPVEIDGREALKIDNTNDAPLRVTLLTIEQPAITAVVYTLTGEIRYDNVQGGGYLEMWNCFAPAKPGGPELKAFSRTMGTESPMAKISGTSSWREFMLPFDRTGASGPPTRLEVNLVLPGRGTVYLGMARLMQLPQAKSLGHVRYRNAWWSDQTAGKLFGWGGALIGCIGSLCGFLAYRGRARGFVMTTFGILSAIGILCLAFGIVGAIKSQPYFVWAPLLGSGVLLSAICPFHLRHYHQKYEQLELRRMASLDASRA